MEQHFVIQQFKQIHYQLQEKQLEHYHLLELIIQNSLVFHLVSGNYTSTVVPVICIVALAAQIQKIAKKFVPEMLQNFFVPFFVLIISLPIGLLVIGPVVSLLTTVYRICLLDFMLFHQL